MLKSFRKNKRMVRLMVVGMVLFALAAPALADHFDWNSFLTSEPDPSLAVTAADAHVECPEEEAEEGATETVEATEGATETVSDCDKAVQQAAADLQAYDHPENHGKYVSFLAHCLKGMKGKGQVMRQIAHADEDEQQELAVRLCAEWKIAQAQEGEDAAESRGKKDKDKGDSDDESEVEDPDSESEVEASDPDEAEVSSEGSKPVKAKSRGKGRGRR